MEKLIQITIVIDHATDERISFSAPIDQTLEEFCDNLYENYRHKTHLFLHPNDNHHLSPEKTFEELGIQENTILYAKTANSGLENFEIRNASEIQQVPLNKNEVNLKITARSGRNQPVNLHLEETVKISEVKNLYKREVGMARDVSFQLFTKDSLLKIPDRQTLKEALGFYNSEIPNEVIELEVDNEQEPGLCKGCSIF